MSEQLLNGVLTVLSASITNVQTVGIQVAAVPATAITGTVRAIFADNQEIITFTGYTGSGPYTLTGVGRGAESTTAIAHTAGVSMGLGEGTAGAMQAAFLATTVPDGTNLAFGTSTGTKLGTATTQKIGFYNATPIVQPTGNVITSLQNIGLISAATLAESDVTSLVSDLAAKAPLASPTFTGTVTTAALTVGDGSNLVVGSTTGTKIGTATTQKLGFYNSAPVVQQTGNIITALSTLGLITSGTITEANVTNLTTDLAAKAPLASPTFTGTVTTAAISIGDASNIAIGTSAGTKIGTATSQKIAFFNSSPITQPTGNIITALQNLGLVSSATITEANVTNLTSDLAAKASLASPTFTGTVTISNAVISNAVIETEIIGGSGGQLLVPTGGLKIGGGGGGGDSTLDFGGGVSVSTDGGSGLILVGSGGTINVNEAITIQTDISVSILGCLFFPPSFDTGSAPTYQEGAMYYDTTLHKLRIGGASGWETVTSI